MDLLLLPLLLSSHNAVISFIHDRSSDDDEESSERSIMLFLSPWKSTLFYNHFSTCIKTKYVISNSGRQVRKWFFITGALNGEIVWIDRTNGNMMERVNILVNKLSFYFICHVCGDVFLLEAKWNELNSSSVHLSLVGSRNYGFFENIPLYLIRKRPSLNLVLHNTKWNPLYSISSSSTHRSFEIDLCGTEIRWRWLAFLRL